MKILVLMGVAGAGKTTVGQLLSKELGWPYFEGDDFHSVRNIEKMSDEVPLTDADRLPWLRNIRNKIDELINKNQSAVIACSALKKEYRDILSAGTDKVRFIYLKADRELIKTRLEERRNHFMKAQMLESQFEILQEPAGALTIDASLQPAKIIQLIKKSLGEDSQL
jgi:gluconokinase